MTHCLLQGSRASFCLPRSPLTSQPCLQPTWLLAGPCQHEQICLCEPGTTRMEIKGKPQSAPWSVLGTWHHGPQGVLSSSSRDPQPKINVSRDSDADLLPPPAPSSEGAGVGRLEEGWLTALPSPGQPVSRWRHQSGDPRPWRS